LLVLALVVAIAIGMRWWPGCLACERSHWRRDETNFFPVVCSFLNGRFVVREFRNPVFYDGVVAGASAVVGIARRLLGMEPSFAAFVVRETAAPHLVVWVARILSIAASAASVVVVARIGQRLFSTSVGGFAGLLLALDGCAAWNAPLCGNESLMVLLGLLSFLTAIGGTSLRRRLASGFLLGLAVATKYSAGILVLPIALAFGMGAWPALLAAAIGFVLGSPVALVDFRDFVRGFTAMGGYLATGWSPDDRRRDELGFVYYVRTFAAAHQGVALASLCAVGIVASIAIVAIRRDRAHALLLAASMPLYVFLGFGIFNMERFLLPALPFIAIHGAWALDRLLSGVARLRTRPVAALVAGLLVIGATAAPTTLDRYGSIRRDFACPEPACVLLAELRPRLAPSSRVAELTLMNEFRLLLARDPWAELGLPAPSDAERRIADEWLAARDFLPTSTPLVSFIAQSRTLAELQEKLRNSRIDTLLVEVQTHQLFSGRKIRPGFHDACLTACPYWDELIDWLEHLPRRAFALSPDRRITAAVLDPGDAPH
jgi:hypothetical protein